MIERRHELDPLYQAGSREGFRRGYRLTFDRQGAGPLQVDADYVILAIPFTTLRDVGVTAPLPDWKKVRINRLGYGDSSKIFLGVNQRTWHNDGFNGGAYSDVGFQNSWDSNQLEPGPASSLVALHESMVTNVQRAPSHEVTSRVRRSIEPISRKFLCRSNARPR